MVTRNCLKYLEIIGLTKNISRGDKKQYCYKRVIKKKIPWKRPLALRVRINFLPLTEPIPQ